MNQKQLDNTESGGSRKRIFHRCFWLRALWLVLASASAILLAVVLILPVLRIYGASMAPALGEGDIVVSVKTTHPDRGAIVGFYHENRILVRRVIAFAGEWVDLDEDGNVYINGQLLEESYAGEKAAGICDIEMPYQVPEGRFFVMGDQRGISVDSRSEAVGCVRQEQMIGRIVLRLWPLNRFGGMK